jgi:predicted CopG family antitoxin
VYEYTDVIKTIRAREAVWAELQRLRISMGLRTMDDVLQHLLELRKQSRARAKGAEEDPILALRGLGKEIWKGVDPDEYVAQLREGW